MEIVLQVAKNGGSYHGCIEIVVDDREDWVGSGYINWLSGVSFRVSCFIIEGPCWGAGGTRWDQRDKE